MTDAIDKPLPERIPDIAGMQFGRLTAITYSHTNRSFRYWWLKCACGAYVLRTDIRTPQSCGCLRNELSAERCRKRATNNWSKDPLYKRWKGILHRCHNPKYKAYRNYGARGIFICDEWRHNFSAFKAWSTENGYRPELDIDRRDNDGPYSPHNCRFVPRIVNANNTRANRLLTHNGKTMTLAQASRYFSIHHNFISRRLQKGFPFSTILEDHNLKIAARRRKESRDG